MYRNVNKVHGGASNIKTGTNPPFILEDFYEIYPQFGKNSEGNYAVPQIVAQMYLDLANASIKKERWRSSWKVGMSLFTAHFLTLYVESLGDPEGGANSIIESGKTRGLDTSMSVDGVSVSTDYNLLAGDIDDWASWSSTSFGQQLSQLGRLVGKGGMVIP